MPSAVSHGLLNKPAEDALAPVPAPAAVPLVEVAAPPPPAAAAPPPPASVEMSAAPAGIAPTIARRFRISPLLAPPTKLSAPVRPVGSIHWPVGCPVRGS